MWRFPYKTCTLTGLVLSSDRKFKRLFIVRKPEMRIPRPIQVLWTVGIILLSFATAQAQLGDPIIVNIRNSGATYTDQFPAAWGYSATIVQPAGNQWGTVTYSQGAVTDTRKVTFTPAQGVVGTTDLIVSYFSVTAPMHPVTRWYRFNIGAEVVSTEDDRFLVDSAAVLVALDVLANDSISNGNLFLKSVTASNAGQAVVNETNDTIYFTPADEFAGDAYFQYVACDSFGNCDQGNVHILVRDPNVEDHRTIKKSLLNRQSLELLTPFTGFAVSDAPSHGALDSINDFSWQYSPEESFTGQDTFTLDFSADVSRTYIVTVYDKTLNVQARDDKFYVRPGLSVSFNVLNNDLLNYDLVSHTNPAKGSLFPLGNGLFTYSPNTGYRGVDNFTYTVCFEDTVYCETATVFLHVTDLEPEAAVSYKLQTSEDQPLVIEWPIAFTDFAYIISEQPANGDLTYYGGVQTVELPCEDIEGFNLLVYTPDPGFTGTDEFEYYYCIVPSNVCYKVTVQMNVVEHPQADEPCPCIVDCVWPGDADQDGRVDMTDLLTIGYHLGETGPVRDYDDPAAWFGQHASSWPYTATGTGPRFSDADGDGVIGQDDVQLVDENYYRSNDVIVRDVQLKAPYQFSLIPVQFSLDSGDVVILDVSIGTANKPVLDMKGIKYSINVPAPMMDSASVEVYFHQNSWLAEGTPSVSLGKVPWDGRIDAGYAKANGGSASGFGIIGTVVFIIEEDVEGFKTGNGLIEVPVRLDAGVMMDGEGNLMEVEGHEVILYLNPSESAPSYELILYPNPTPDIVNVHVNGRTAIHHVEIFDVQGRQISTPVQIEGKHATLTASSLPAGQYFVRVTHDHGVLVKSLIVAR